MISFKAFATVLAAGIGYSGISLSEKWDMAALSALSFKSNEASCISSSFEPNGRVLFSNTCNESVSARVCEGYANRMAWLAGRREEPVSCLWKVFEANASYESSGLEQKPADKVWITECATSRIRSWEDIGYRC